MRWTSPTPPPCWPPCPTPAPDAVYHLAALTHVGQSWDEPLRVLEVNVIGTGAVLAAARQCGTDPRVLVTSSAEVYGAVTDPALLPADRGVADRPADALRGQQAGGRGPGGPGVPRARPARDHRPALQPHRPGQSPNFAVPALAKRIVEADRQRGADHPGRQPVGPAGLHRRPRRGAGLPAPDRVRRARVRSTTSARAGTSRSRRSPTACSPWPAPPSSSRPTRRWSGRSRSRCSGAIPARLTAATGWKPEIPLEQTLADVLAYWRQQAG